AHAFLLGCSGPWKSHQPLHLGGAQQLRAGDGIVAQRVGTKIPRLGFKSFRITLVEKYRTHFPGAPVPWKSPPRARYRFTRSRRREARTCVNWTFAARFSPVRRRTVNMSIWPCSSCSLLNLTESALLETASPSAPSRLRR